MNENEDILALVEETLQAAYEVQQELEFEMWKIENPNIKTNMSKRKVRNRMRLINNIIYTGEKAKESLLAEQGKVMRKRRR